MRHLLPAFPFRIKARDSRAFAHPGVEFRGERVSFPGIIGVGERRTPGERRYKGRGFAARAGARSATRPQLSGQKRRIGLGTGVCRGNQVHLAAFPRQVHPPPPTSDLITRCRPRPEEEVATPTTLPLGAHSCSQDARIPRNFSTVVSCRSHAVAFLVSLI